MLIRQEKKEFYIFLPHFIISYNLGPKLGGSVLRCGLLPFLGDFEQNS